MSTAAEVLRTVYGRGLPSAPDSKLYREMEAELEWLADNDPKEGQILLAGAAELDFWFWNKYVMSVGSFRIRDRNHPRYGALYVDEPFFFDRAREVQEDFEGRRDRVWYRWFRFSFKTTMIVKGGSLWLLARNPQETIGIWTHKVTQQGEGMGQDILSEIRENRTLQDHWPCFRNLKEASGTRITVDRELGPKDPSISVRPILGSSTGGRFTWMFVDDAVEEKIIESKELTRKVDRQIARLFPLKADDAPVMFIGTIWGTQDPMLLRERDGFFAKVSHQPCFLPGNVPQLRSKEFFLDLRSGMKTATKDDFEWQTQLMLRLVPRGNRYFKPEWFRYYAEKPRQIAAAMGGGPDMAGWLEIVIDPAGGEEDSDFTTLRVTALGMDGNMYHLDLWRERIDLIGMYDLLFGVGPAELLDAENELARMLAAGGLQQGIVRYWQPLCRDLVVWVEEFGASAWKKALRKEAERRKIEVEIKELPKLNRSKPSRIRFFQLPMREGKNVFPAAGFGHGSIDDRRDTLAQMKEDEYELWSLNPDLTASGTMNDDVLDNFAWSWQEEMVERIAWPVVMAGHGGEAGWPYGSSAGGEGGAGVMPGSVSRWVY